MDILTALDRPLLLIAHPGHELHVFGWLAATAPRVCILTDGSGRAGAPRTQYTHDLLEAAGAIRGAVFGSHSDAAIYRALLGRSHELFVGLAQEIAADIDESAPSSVVTDALTGYNPVHDLCRWIAGAALAMSGRRGIPQYEFSTAARVSGDGFRFELDAAAAGTKLAAANAYAPLRAEVNETLQQHGDEFVRVERFARVADWTERDPFGGRAPDYERTGDALVADGTYRETIRFREHLLPVRDALCAAVEIHA